MKVEDLRLDNIKAMSSREIAELTGKRHDNVLRDVGVLNKTYAKVGETKVGLSSYISKQNKKLQEYKLSKAQVLDLLSGYSHKLRLQVIKRITAKEGGVPMNELQAISQSQELTMSSREIADLTGKRHTHVLRDISKMLEGLDLETKPFLGWLKDGKGELRKVYNLPKRECLVLVTGYNVKLRAAIIDRWRELEAKEQTPKVPQTFADALRLAADQQELLEAQKPKVEFYDTVADSSDALSMRDVSKIINRGIGSIQLFKFLRNNKVLMTDNIPYQNYINRGWFKVIEQKYKVKGKINISKKTLVYQKGVAGIIALLDKLHPIKNQED